MVHQVTKSLLGNEDFESNVLPVGTEVYTLKEDDPNLPGNKLAVLVDGEYRAAYRIYDSVPVSTDPDFVIATE